MRDTKVALRPARRWSLFVAVVVLFSLVAAACADGETQGETQTETGGSGIVVEPRTIGYVDGRIAAPIQGRFYDVVSQAAEHVGWTVTLGDANGDINKALTIVQNFVNQGVDAIIASSVEAAWIRPALADAREAGIPVVAIGGQIEEPDAFDAAYLEDEVLLTRTLGETLLADLENLGGGKVALLEVSLLISGRTRPDTMEQMINETEGVEVSARSDIGLAGNPVQDTRNAVTSMLTSDRDTRAIFGTYDWMSGPATEALKNAGLEGEVNVYSYYVNDVNLPLLQQGSDLKAVVDGNVEATGLVAIDQLLRFFTADEPLDPNALADLAPQEYVVITSENVPEGEAEGVVPRDELLSPFFDRWDSEYGE